MQLSVETSASVRVSWTVTGPIVYPQQEQFYKFRVQHMCTLSNGQWPADWTNSSSMLTYSTRTVNISGLIRNTPCQIRVIPIRQQAGISIEDTQNIVTVNNFTSSE